MTIAELYRCCTKRAERGLFAGQSLCSDRRPISLEKIGNRCAIRNELAVSIMPVGVVGWSEEEERPERDRGTWKEDRFRPPRRSWGLCIRR